MAGGEGWEERGRLPACVWLERPPPSHRLCKQLSETASFLLQMQSPLVFLAECAVQGYGGRGQSDKRHCRGRGGMNGKTQQHLKVEQAGKKQISG